MNDSLWPVCLALTAWIAVGVVACVAAHLEDSLAKEKIRLSMLETAVSVRGDLLVKKQDELEVELKDCRDGIKALKGRLETFEHSMALEVTGLREEMEVRHG